jgi:transcription elongation factor GreA
VKVKDLIENKEVVFTLVGPGDEDPEKRKILTTSPRGKGLLGRRRGETVEIIVPKGTLKYTIIDIFFG